LYKIFISYAREDSDQAIQLSNDLKQNDFEIWFDKEKLLPGEKWEVSIKKAIKNCNIFIALLSNHSVKKSGYVQKELNTALQLLDEIPESQIFLIPARLDDCLPSHEKLRDLNWIDLFDSYEEGLNKIAYAIKKQPINGNKKEKKKEGINKLSKKTFLSSYFWPYLGEALTLFISLFITALFIDKFNLTKLKTFLFLVSFFSIYVATNALLQYFIYIFFYDHSIIKKILSKNKRKNYLKITLIFVIIPLLIGLSVHEIKISGISLMDYVLDLFAKDKEIVSKIENIILNTNDYDVKIAGILTLKEVANKYALNSLITISKEHNNKYNDYQTKSYYTYNDFYCHLSKSIASFGERAKTLLVNMYYEYENNVDVENTRSDYYKSLLEKRFTIIVEDFSKKTKNSDINNEVMLELNTLRQQLVKSLNNLENRLPCSTKNAITIIDLVFDSFWNMKNLSKDQKVLELAKLALINKNYSVQTKRRAVKLIAKNGDKTDITFILKCIETISDETFTERALEVIAYILHNQHTEIFKEENISGIDSCN